MRDFESRVEILVSLGIVDSGVEIPIEGKKIEPEGASPGQLLLDGTGVVMTPTTKRLKNLVGTVDEQVEMIAIGGSSPAVEVVSAEPCLRLCRSCGRLGENAWDAKRQRVGSATARPRVHDGYVLSASN